MADDSELIGDDDIEALLNQAKNVGSSSPANAGAAPPAVGQSANDVGDVGQDEIDALLSGMGESTAAPTQAATAAQRTGGVATAISGGGHTTATTGSKQSGSNQPGDDIQLLLDQAEQAIASVNEPAPSPADVQTFQFRDLAGSPASREKATIDLLRDVELDLKIELGRTQMELEELLKLRRGSVVSLDKLAGDPVDVYVNGRLIARGEVLVLNDNFCVRVAELISGDD